jgi:hypothetical protein
MAVRSPDLRKPQSRHSRIIDESARNVAEERGRGTWPSNVNEEAPLPQPLPSRQAMTINGEASPRTRAGTHHRVPALPPPPPPPPPTTSVAPSPPAAVPVANRSRSRSRSRSRIPLPCPAYIPSPHSLPIHSTARGGEITTRTRRRGKLPSLGDEPRPPKTPRSPRTPKRRLRSA